ncbi:MAG: hypothetical protein AB1898_17685 [Acidobacteriota bacterium]
MSLRVLNQLNVLNLGVPVRRIGGRLVRLRSGPGFHSAVVVLLIALWFGAGALEAQNVVPAEFVGDWVPAKGGCESPVRFRVEGNRFTLINGRDSAVYGNLHLSASYFGPSYSGISQVIAPEINSDDPPFLAYFNYEEKKGVTLLDIYTEAPLSPHAVLAAQQMAHKKLAQRFPLNQIALKKCAAGAQTVAPAANRQGQPAGQSRPASAAAARPVTKNPPVCPGVQFCEEVNDFAVTITDFRASLNAATKVLTATLRFRNKSDHPVTLAYVPGSGVATDERGNRYATNEPDIRGIGSISSRGVDDKFLLQPGQESDARFSYYWNAGREIFGTTFEVELTVREVLQLSNGQVKLGAESPLRFTGLTHRSIAAPVSQQAPAAAPASENQPSTSLQASAVPQENHCEGSKQPCYDAGAFSATLVGLTQAMVGVRHHTVRMNISFKNWTDQPLILAYKNASNSMTDNLGNAYYWGRAGTYDNSVQGIGTVIPGRSSDSRFRLAPGQSASATFNMVRYEAGNKPKGTSFTLDTAIVELRILPNGQQTEIVREYSVHLPDMSGGGISGNAPSSESIREAGRKLGDIFKRKK